jgi:hypothetical protein
MPTRPNAKGKFVRNNMVENDCGICLRGALRDSEWALVVITIEDPTLSIVLRVILAYKVSTEFRTVEIDSVNLRH